MPNWAGAVIASQSPLVAGPRAGRQSHSAARPCGCWSARCPAASLMSARALIARFLGKYLPQSPTVVVQNMPAANGIAAANYFTQQVAPDGLTFLAGSSSQVTPDVIRTNTAVRYDPAKFAIHRRSRRTPARC